MDSAASRYIANGGASAQVPIISIPNAWAIFIANTSESLEKPTQRNLDEFRILAAWLSSIAIDGGTPSNPKNGV